MRSPKTLCLISIASMLAAITGPSVEAAESPPAHPVQPAPPAQPVQLAPPAEPLPPADLAPPARTTPEEQRAPPEPDKPAWPEGPLTLVELSGDDPTARLLYVDPQGASIEICRVPCSRRLNQKARYQILAASVGATRIFELPSDRAHVTLDVDPGSRARAFSGIAMIIGGLAGSLLGEFLVIGEGIDVQDAAQRARDEQPGYIFVGTSLAVAIIGGLLLLTSGSSIDSNTDLRF